MSVPFNTSKNAMLHNFKDGSEKLGIDVFAKKAWDIEASGSSYGWERIS